MIVTSDSPQPPSGYPLTLDVEYPASLNRWLVLVKWILVIPQLIVVRALDAVAQVLTLIAFFAILFTAKYPRSMFDFVLGIRRWEMNVTAYASLMRDEYPPFSLDAGKYPVTYDIAYPEHLNRALPLIKWLLAIPHYFVLFFLAIASLVVMVIAFFAILFSAKYPESLFQFTVGVMRWGQRVQAYILLMTDEYPPFSLQP